MKFKKLVSAISALALSASAFAGLMVSADAESATTEVVYSNDCTTTDGWAGNTIALDETSSYVGLSGGGNGNRSSLFTFPEEVSSITSGNLNISFDFYFSDNNGVANRSVAQIALLSGELPAADHNDVMSEHLWALTSTTWSGTRNDIYCPSDKPETQLTVNKAEWYTVNANIDFDNYTLDVSVTPTEGGTALYTATGIAITGTNLTGLFVLSPRYSTTRTTYIDNIEVTTPKIITDETVVYENDCTTADGWSGSATAAVDTTGEYVGLNGSGSGNRGALFAFPESVTDITSGNVSVSFDFYFSDNTGEGRNGAVAQIALLSNESPSVSQNDLLSEYFWALTGTWGSADTRNDYYVPSNDTLVSHYFSTQTWYTIKADIDFDNDTLDVSVIPTAGGNLVHNASDIDITGTSLTGLFVLSPRWQAGTRTTYIDNIKVSVLPTPTVSAKSAEADYSTLAEQITATSASDESEKLTLEAGAGVYTMWIKTENCESKPTITLTKDGGVVDGAANIAITTYDPAQVDGEGYFCVQILKDGLDAGNYTATFASDGASCDVTFTVE